MWRLVDILLVLMWEKLPPNMPTQLVYELGQQARTTMARLAIIGLTGKLHGIVNHRMVPPSIDTGSAHWMGARWVNTPGRAFE